MPGPCWVGVGRSSQTGSGSPRDPHQTTTVSLTQATTGFDYHNRARWCRRSLMPTVAEEA